MLRRTALTVLAVLLVGATVRAAAPRFWRLEGTAAFLGGELENLSLDSEGRLRLGPAVRTLFDPTAPNAWCVAADGDGALYVGTGNEGRVYRIDGEEGRVVFDADELEVYAVAVAPDGQVYAGTSPDGAVFALEADGSARPVFDPSEPYVWALAFDAEGHLLVATGGGEGRVYRLGADGAAETLLTSAETHILSLAVDDGGRVFAGSSPEGIVYRIDPSGQVFVLLDSAFREIKALAVSGDGALYAAAVNGGATPPPSPPSPPPPAPEGAAPTPVAQVTVTESFAVVPPAAAAPASGPATTSTAATPRGAVLRIDPGGTLERLWTSSDDVPHALMATDAGALVGTGDKGKLYRVTPAGTWTLVASVRGRQITGLVARPGREVALVTSNPARALALSAESSTEGTFVSEVKDAEAVASWGRIRWEGHAPSGAGVRLETRSGNTSTPDSTWTSWTAVAGGPEAAGIRSESARFLQLRLTLAAGDGVSPEIEALSAAYLQRNLRPRVASITVHAPGEVFQKPISVSGEPEILGLERDPLQKPRPEARSAATGPVTAFSRKLHQKGLRTFAWKAEDPNGDALVYEVQYRAVGDTRWRALRSGLEEPVLAWDTTAVPDGRYLVRIIASDSPDNPPSLALSNHDDSASFLVDNAPPTLVASLAGDGPGTSIRATARDAGSPIRKLEVSVDAGRWQEVYPTDGINDSREETYQVPLPAAVGPGPHVVVLRVSDGLGNVATGRVDVP
jgi:sugar lactone lactonase YvrE